MRQLATVRRIADILPIEGADAIVLAKIDGWQVVVKKDQFKIGDLCIYMEIDSYLPLRPQYEDIRARCYKKMGDQEGLRIKTVKLRGTVSQGLALPVSSFFDEFIDSDYDEGQELSEFFFEGNDLTEFLGVQKYELPVPAQLAGLAKGNFPSFGRKTDQERIENLVRTVFEENKDSRFEVSLKLNGSSCSVYYYNGEVGVCSRNLNLKLTEENATNSFVSTVFKTKLIDALSSLGQNLMVSMELMGPGIQGNMENLKETKLYVFDIFDISLQEYVAPVERIAIFDKLRALGFTGEHVPIIETDVTLPSIGISDVMSSKIYVDRPSISSPIAEGCVFKRMDGKFSFKSINNRFLLKFE